MPYCGSSCAQFKVRKPVGLEDYGIEAVRATGSKTRPHGARIESIKELRRTG
jgi:hypothetical protein